MDELTKYFSHYVKANNKILANYQKGFLTLQEAANLIIKEIQKTQQIDAARAVLDSYNFKGYKYTADEIAESFVNFYGDEAPQKIVDLLETE